MKPAQIFSIFVGLSLAGAHAATLTVTSTADTGAGSLRSQIAAAASGDVISITATGTILLTTGEIGVTGKNLTIAGPGAGSLTVTTNATTRAFHLTGSASTISGITFSNCKGLPGDIDTGGAILIDNFSSGGSSNVTTINRCAFNGNQSGWGGAVDVFNGGLIMSSCTFVGNSSTGVAFGTSGGGGALSLGPTVASSITNCTFSANAQNGAAAGQPGGGAIYNYGAVAANPAAITIEHCTFVGNLDASGAAAAIRGNYTASYVTLANVRNCLLLNNQAPSGVLRNFAGNPSGTLTLSYNSLGGNATDEAVSSALFMSNSDVFNNATLGSTVASALSANGSDVATYAITRGSPAQRLGLASTVSTDERGAPRHLHADAGAFELIEPELRVSVSQVPLAGNGLVDFGVTSFNTPITQTITITNTQSSPLATGPLALDNLTLPAGFTSTNFPTGVLGNGQSADFIVTLAAVDPGLYRSQLTFAGTDSFDPALALAQTGLPNQHTISLTGLVTDSFQHWLTHYFGPGVSFSGDAADSGNPSGDGIPNLMKYALGLNPFVAYPPGTGITSALTGNRLTMTVLKNPAATDLTLAIQVTGQAADPSSWNASGVTIDVNTPVQLQGHDNTDKTQAPARFIRLSVGRP